MHYCHESLTFVKRLRCLRLGAKPFLCGIAPRSLTGSPVSHEAREFHPSRSSNQHSAWHLMNSGYILYLILAERPRSD